MTRNWRPGYGGENMALKTNVVKTSWLIVAMDGKHRRDYIVEAESEEAAKLKVPEEYEILSVERLDGR